MKMICFAFAKVKTRVISKFRLMQRWTEIGNFTLRGKGRAIRVFIRGWGVGVTDEH